MQLAERIGTGVRAVADAEAGKPSSSVGVTVAILWALGLLNAYTAVAEPGVDEEGERLALMRERKRAGSRRALDNDF